MRHIELFLYVPRSEAQFWGICFENLHTIVFVHVKFWTNWSILNFLIFLIFCWRHRLSQPNDDDDGNWLDDNFEIYVPWPLFMQNLKSIRAFWKFRIFLIFWWRHRLPRPNHGNENWLDDIFVIYIPWSLFMQNLKSIGAVWKFQKAP